MTAPSGVVTLLMTDVEGSTRLWEERPEAMAASLRRLDELLRAVLAETSGYLFKTVGDAFWVAFASAHEGVRTAVAMQRALQGATWPDRARLRVRMGLHSGECEERDGDYFGPVVNRTARLEATAAGDQIVVSMATASLVEEEPPGGVELIDLGSHRLKDLGRPERVYQVSAPGLRADFPPLRSLDNPRLRHNLPEQVSSFVGREAELDALTSLLEGERLVTVVGTGGSGKSRLALQAGANLLDGSGAGVWFVKLDPLVDPALVAGAVGAALGVRENPERQALDVLCDALRDRRLLIILDNCEHLIDACAVLVDRLLHACPAVHVMATSREPLGIPGETVFRVPPLSVPAPDELDPAVVAHSEAVRLFVERAMAAERSFHLDETNATHVASICRHLDGIPLAIELAAVRLRALSARDIDSRLDERFRLLRGGTRAGLAHHRTLEATIDWSYELLTAQEQAFFDRLSVFARRWELVAAEAIFDELQPDTDPVSVLSALADKSLVQVDSSGSTHYELLESLRDYGRAHLAARGPDVVAQAHAAHLEFYLTVAETADAGLDASEPESWLAQFELQQENLRAALSWSVEHDPGRALQLVGAMARFWDERGSVLEGQQWVGAALAAGRSVGTRPQVARALWAAGLLGRGALPEMQGDFRESRELARECGDRWTEAAASLGLAGVLRQTGDCDQALALAGDAWHLYQEQGNLNGEAAALESLAATSLYLGRLDDVERYAADGEAKARELGNLRTVGLAKALRMVAALTDGKPEVAAAMAAEAVELADVLGNRTHLALVLEAAGGAQRDCGNLPEAADLMIRALELSIRPAPDLLRLISAVMHAGATLVRAGEPAGGVALMAAEERLSDEVGYRPPPGVRPYLDAFRDEGRRALGPEWSDAVARTEGMSAEDVVALAIEWLSPLAEGAGRTQGHRDPSAGR